ncbi:MAG: HAMP domain-containing sensor histidine kinase [Pirellulales bacterium]
MRDAARISDPSFAEYELWVAALRHRNRRLEDRLLAVQRELADLRSSAQDLEHAKLESLKELAYGASHEINNPLANIAGRAQTLLKDERDPQRRRMLESIHAQALRAHEMIADLMLFARPPALELQETDLRELVTQVAEELASAAADRQVALHTDLPTACDLARIDRTQISIALRALADNSLEAIGVSGEIVLGCRAALAKNRYAELFVRDTGPGIPPEIREHLFDPFFSGREAGRGLGFGLSKCWRIVTDHGGKIQVESQPAQGTIITLSLPAAVE